MEAFFISTVTATDSCYNSDLRATEETEKKDNYWPTIPKTLTYSELFALT